MPIRSAAGRAAVLALLATTLLADPAAAAPAGFAFLETPAGARLSALGGAGATLARGAEAAFWNPAGLDDVRGVQFTASHFELWRNLRHEDVAIAGRMFGGAVSASLRALYSEAIEQRDEVGNLIGSFGAHDLEFALGYATRVAPGVTAGVSGQIVRERIAELAAQTWAVSLGAAWDVARWPGMRVALGAHNLGPSAAYTIDGAKGEPVALPAAVQGGVSYALPAGRGLDLRAAAESRFTRGRPGVGVLAAELSGFGAAALRLGVRVNDDAANVSLGAGWALPALRLDYAWVPSRLDLEDTHRIALHAQF
uniref:PorV/PorQ family protein n=1 Tax=Eiseniibacteriota bacterium TaxID=2212470 RepID=A0A832MLI7_UNCEI